MYLIFKYSLKSCCDRKRDSSTDEANSTKCSKAQKSCQVRAMLASQLALEVKSMNILWMPLQILKKILSGYDQLL